MKLQYCLSVMTQNKTLQTVTKQTSLLNHFSQYFEFLTHSSPALSAAVFSHVILQTASKMLNWFQFAWSPLMTHDTHASKICKKLVQNATKQRKHVPGVWGKPCQVSVLFLTCLPHQQLLAFSCCHVWQSLGLALVSNTDYSVTKVTLLLQVTVWLLWDSAYMSLISLCGVEASSGQLVPEVMKGLNSWLTVQLHAAGHL